MRRIDLALALMLPAALISTTPAMAGKEIRFQDAILVSFREIPSGPTTFFDEIERHLQWQLQRDLEKDDHPAGKALHGLNVATGGVNRRAMEEEGLRKQLMQVAAEKSEDELRVAQAGTSLQPCNSNQAKDCIRPSQKQYTVRLGNSELLITPVNSEADPLNAVNPGDHMSIGVTRDFVLVKSGEHEYRYTLLEASW